MARPRKKKSASGPYWAWSNIYKGGESKETKDGRKLIVSRDIHEAGEPVSASDLGISDEEFDHLIKTGVVRDYPHPEDMPKDYPGSPVQFVQETLARQRDAEDESMETEGEMLVRSYVTGTLFESPQTPEPVLAGVEEGTGTVDDEE